MVISHLLEHSFGQEQQAVETRNVSLDENSNVKFSRNPMLCTQDTRYRSREDYLFILELNIVKSRTF